MKEKDLAIQTLKAICSDDSNPATARASAARTLLELAGVIGRLQTERPNTDKPLHEMDINELNNELIKRKALVDNGQAIVNSVSSKQTTKPKLKRKPREKPKAKPDWLL